MMPFKKRLRPHVPIPKQIGGLVLWLDAADTDTITDTTGSVTQWDDKSPNQYHFAQGTGAEQPTTDSVTTAGKNVIDYDGTDDNVELASAALRTALSINTDQSVFFVFKADSTSGTQVPLISANTAGDDWYVITLINNNLSTAFFNGATYTNGQGKSSFTDTTNYNVLTAIYDQAGASTAARLNGTAFTGAVSGNGAGNLQTTIGSRAGATSPFNGQIAEIIIYDSQLSDANRDKIEAYLGQKWGITVA